MEEQVRILNEKGRKIFREYLAELRDGLTSDPPWELLTDPWCTDRIQGEIDIDGRIFNSRFDVAKFLYERFRILSHSQVAQNVGLWSWLSLYYFNQVCPKNNFGRRIPGRDCRHILDLDYRYYYRHLLIGPYNIFALHGELAPLLLYGPLHKTSKCYDELSCRQNLITNRGVIEAANLLYFDNLNWIPKRGAAVTTRKPGTLFRFIDVVQQLDLTYDLYSMTGEEVLALLPSEFDEWRPVSS